MFFRILILGLVFIYVYLWGDYIKILILLELVRVIFLFSLLWILHYDYFSLNFFFSCLIFLVCESSLGFLLFIFYIRLERDVVKKINLIQF